MRPGDRNTWMQGEGHRARDGRSALKPTRPLQPAHARPRTHVVSAQRRLTPPF